MALDPSLITSVMSQWQTPDPLAAYAKIQALKNGIIQQQVAQQQLASGAVELQQRQQAFADQQALDAAYRGAITTDANGNISYDRAKVLSSVPGHLAPGIQKTLNEMDQAKATLDETQAKAKTDQANLLGGMLIPIVDSNYDPATFQAVVTHAAGTGALDPHQASAWLQQLGPNPTPDQIKAAVAPYLAAPAVQELMTKRQTAQAATERAAAATKQADTAAEKERLAKVEKAKDALGAAGSQEQLNTGLKNLVTAGATPDEVAQVPQMYSPAAMTAYNQSRLTPDQRRLQKQAEDAAAALAAHQKVLEQQGAARVAQGWERVKIAREEAQQRQGVLGGPPLSIDGQKRMTEINTVANQFDDLLAKLEPYKTNNNPFTLTSPYLKYKLGIKTPEGELGNEISNLSLASIQGMMPFASKSRNYQFIKDIGQHLPVIGGLTPDSPALIYDKLSKARRNFLRMEAATSRYDIKGAGANPPKPVLPEDSALAYYTLAGGDPKKAQALAEEDGWTVK